MDVKKVVKKTYGQAALKVVSSPGTAGCCCNGNPSSCGAGDPITGNLYDISQMEALPDTAVLASLGCGNPTALAELQPGETVLDLGSGGGIDVLLSARRVSPGGKAYGLDMTDEMLALARENMEKSGLKNVEFLKGEIEDIPLADSTVDVIISNCVINLSGDKDAVFAEAYRVLRPGGRLAVSDIVVRGEIPDTIRKNFLLWAGCIAGALEADAYCKKLTAAGFVDISIEPTRVYKSDDLLAMFIEKGFDVGELAPKIEGKFFSGFIRARKPELVTT